MGHDSLEIEVIARGVLFHEEHVLLCRSEKGGHSYLPGGHVEFGESAEAAVSREFLEETGLHVTPRACLLAHEHLFRQAGRLRHEYNVVFHVEHSDALHPARAPVPSLESKITFAWVHADDLATTDLQPSQLAPWLRSLLLGQQTGMTWLSTTA